MAKPLLSIYFHGYETDGPILRSARKAVDKGAAESSPTRRSLPAVLRLANSLGSPVYVSLTNERLLRALTDPAEKKALTDGLSRGKLLPVPTSGLGCEQKLLSLVEISDDVRMNVDLWKLAFITPPFAPIPRTEARTTHWSSDPAAALAREAGTFRGETAVLGVSLVGIESGADPEAAIARLGDHLKTRNDVKLAQPSQGRMGAVDKFVTEILTHGARVPTFGGDTAPAFDLKAEGYPLDLMRTVAADALAARSLAPHGRTLIDAQYAADAIDPIVGRGLWLRRLYRAAYPDGTSKSERLRQQLTCAIALTASLLHDTKAGEGTIGLELFDGLAHAHERVAKVLGEGVPAEAAKALERAAEFAKKPTGRDRLPRAEAVARTHSLNTELVKAFDRTLGHSGAKAQKGVAASV
jgi:hypothetical protein